MSIASGNKEIRYVLVVKTGRPLINTLNFITASKSKISSDFFLLVHDFLLDLLNGNL